MSKITPLTITRETVGEGESPLLSVVMIDSRGKINPDMVERALNSIREQSFAVYIGNIEIIIVNNQDRFHTIGKCYNFGIASAKCEWVMMMDDDDYITPDYFASLWAFYCDMKKEHKDSIAIITSFSTYVDDEKEQKALVKKAPMGFYNREFAVKKGFDETLSKYVDIDFMQRCEKDKKQMFICPWHFGYHYHQHSGNVSGRKAIGKKDKE